MLILVRKHTRNTIVSILMALAMLPAADATYMHAKAKLAQVLIERSWNTDARHPWPWADTAPVARLVIPRVELDNYVLDGATGSALAFGPGMVSGSAEPGSNGVTMIAAHRDTHFEPLRDIEASDVIRIQGADKHWHQYRVTKISIADNRVDTFTPSISESVLVLVTCYPFDAVLPGGPLRYVVEAELISA